MNVKGKAAIVTASTRGIGWACVKALAKEGAIVYMAARNRKRLNRGDRRACRPGAFSKNGYTATHREESYASMARE